MNITKNILLVTMIGCISLYANHPSFNCTKVKKDSSEGIICAKSYSFDKTLSLQGITFHVRTIGEGSLRQLSIVPTGLKEVNSVINQEIDGEVLGMEIDDINGDGSPEIYIYITSSGSGGYGNVVAYSANNKKSLSSIYLAEIETTSKEGKGYMGHDVFSLDSDSLIRRFPIYKENDSNAKPTGGTRQLEYKLKAGEASWVLKLVNITEF